MANIFTKKIVTIDAEVFGMDLSDLSIKVMQLEKDGKFERVKGYACVEVPPGVFSDGKILNREKAVFFIKEVLKKTQPGKIKTNKVICSLPESKVFLRLITVPKISEEEIAEAIKWEMEANIPLPIDQVYFDWQTFEGEDAKQQDVLTVAAEKKVVDEMMDVMKEAGLDVYGLEVESIASARSLVAQSGEESAKNKKKVEEKNKIEEKEKTVEKIETKAIEKVGEKESVEVKTVEKIEEKGKPKEKEVIENKEKIEDEKRVDNSLVIDLGSQRTSFIIVINGITCFTSSIPFSSDGINDVITKAIGVDIKEAEKIKLSQGIEPADISNPIFKATQYLMENLTSEIEKTLDFYGETFKTKPAIEKIILSGGGSNIKGLASFLEKRLNKKVEIGNPWVNVKIDKNGPIIDNVNSIRYSTAIGLALRSLYYED